ncbi:glycosyltransferase family 4 protein [Streptomyces sp. CC210A]|nr:glycosyltransferase family 4 protein [Streptomyces sp. CC210A]
MKISFLIHTIYGIGGTIRTTLNLAEELAARHDVEIVSVFRHRDIPLFSIDPRITVVPLVDTRPSSPTCEKQHPDQLTPAAFFPRSEARYAEYSKLTDARVRAHYATSDADVVIGTRPGLVAYAAQFAPRGAVLIGQEHMTHHHHKAELREEIRPHLEALDAFVTVSEGDAAVWREQMRLPATRVLCIPNSVPAPMVAPSGQSSTTVVAAGRLSKEKQYDVLITAFAKVAEARPAWTLRICGWGPEKARLRARIDRLRLHNHVFLMGPRAPIEPEWAKGAIAASTSRHESFGMTLVESMRCGVPMVSTDCDYGPREIIEDGEDGLLVPVGDADAVAEALLTLIDDEDLRRSMGQAALRNARRFDPGTVAAQYADLFAALGAGPHPAAPARGTRTASTGGGSLQESRAAQDSADDPEAGGPSHEEKRAAQGRAGDGTDGFTPLADAVAESDGSISVTLVTPPGGAARHDGLRLVCVPHAGPARTQAAAERTYAFDSGGTATIPAGDDFAEGTWVCHAAHPAGGPHVPVTARSADQRGSMDAARRLRPGAPVRHLVPHRRSPEPVLEIRAWSRDVHAEAGDIHVTRHDITVTGRLHGEPGRTRTRPQVLMRLAGSDREVTADGCWLPDGGFRLPLPLTGPVEQHVGTAPDTWSLWLRHADDRPPLRISRILDDIVAKADVLTYRPAARLKPRPLLFLRRAWRKLRGRKQLVVTMTAFYDRDNALHVRVQDR